MPRAVKCGASFMDDGYRAVTDEIGRRRVGKEINPQQGHAAAPSAARQAADFSQNALHCLHLLVFWVERDRRRMQTIFSHSALLLLRELNKTIMLTLPEMKKAASSGR